MPAAHPAYQRLLHRPVVTLEDAAEAYGGRRRAATQALYGLQRGGYLAKVRRGLYVKGPRQDPTWAQSLDPYLIAARLGPKATLAYHSALVVAGVAQNPSERRIHVAVPARFAPFVFQGIRFEPHMTPSRVLDRAAIRVPREGEVIRVTRPEWTLAMCCRRPAWAAGFEEITSSATGFRSVDAAEVFEACKVIGTSGIFNRAGFLLWLNRNVWRLEPEEIEPFRERISQSPVYFESRTSFLAFVPEWRLYVPHSAKGVAAPGPD